jgi:orotate phosphoribosyltransferase
MRWIYYHWGVSLSYEGLILSAACVLDVLRGFESVQIASIGMTGMPLVAAVVAQGSGRYSGLCIRAEREKHGTRRKIEGIGDKSLPVVVLDDCICSGNSIKSAFSALESEGYSVEGGIAMVNFPGRGGVEWARALGYRFETLFDIWTDLGMYAEEVQSIVDAPRMVFSCERKVPEDLTPADAVRWIAACILKYGTPPSPPDRLAGIQDAAGGVMVSFRDRRSDRRIARDGFYRAESAPQYSLGEDLVIATVKTLQNSHGAVAAYGLDQLKVGVTLFGQQERIQPRDLDFAKFGILARSDAFPDKHGGALPNTQFFVSEIEQLYHARFTNARLDETEPFSLYRHSVAKSVESSCTWPSYGVPENPVDEKESRRFGALLIERVRELLSLLRSGAESSDTFAADSERFSESASPLPVLGVAVSLYRKGMIGCWVTSRGSLDQMLKTSTIGAWSDDRYSDRKRQLKDADHIDIVVSVVCGSERLGSATIEDVARRLRPGKDSLFACDGEKSAMTLSYILCHYDWSRKQMAECTLRKAGISKRIAAWTLYSTRSWLGRSNGVVELEFGYPASGENSERICYERSIRLLASHIMLHVDERGVPAYCYHPLTGDTIQNGSRVRVILALESLLDASNAIADEKLRQAACDGLRSLCGELVEHAGRVTLVPDDEASAASSDVALINAIYRTRDPDLISLPAVQAVKDRVLRMFHPDGAITWEPQGKRVRSDHDLFPGSVLRMAANIAAIDGVAVLPMNLPAHLDWYRRRFRMRPRWGMIWWQIQGWAALNRLRSDPEATSFIYEMADWALNYQLDVNGAFLVDYNLDGPSFHTACVMEGVVDAWALAERSRENERSQRYAHSWRRAHSFIQRLILHENDTFAMQRPDLCIGGVRATLTSSALRIDYTAHALSAIARGYVMEKEGGLGARV